MAYGWEGKLVRLVPLSLEKHYENALKWLNDPEVTQFMLVGDFPMCALEERDYFESMMKGSRTDVAFAIETLDGMHIGFSGIHGIDFRHGTATTGSFLAQDAWGKGYGTDSARTRARYAFDVLGLRMLLSSALEGNERSLRMQERVGYVQCGIFPKRYWKRGMYRDETRTYMTRDMLRDSEP